MTAQIPDRQSRFQSLYAGAYSDVLRFTQRRIDPAHAEDVTADAFLVAWRRLDDAPIRPDDLRAWLFGIARNCLLNAIRSDGRRVALAVRVAEAFPSTHRPGGNEAENVAHRVDLSAAWQRLSSTDQETLSLTVFEDLTSPQAGRVLGISAACYRLRLLRARRALRQQLDLAEPASPVQMETQS